MNNFSLSNINTNKDFREEDYINKCRASYTLEECLNNVSDKILDNIYTYYNNFFFNNKLNLKVSRNKKISILLKNLPKSFNESICDFYTDENKVLRNYKCDTYIYDCNLSMLAVGFMYGFIENDKKVFVIPNEFIKIYNTPQNKKLLKEKDDLDTSKIMGFYSLVNGVFPIDLIKKIFKDKYDISIDEDLFIKLCNNFKIYNNNYALLNSDFDFNILINMDNKLPYKIFDYLTINQYLNFLISFIEDVRKLLKIEEKDTDKIYSLLFNSYKSLDKNLKIIKNIFNVDDESFNLLKDYMKYNIEMFHFWDLSGRTISEYNLDMECMDLIIKKSGAKNDISSLINSMNKKSINILYKKYKVNNIGDLIKSITKCFKTYLAVTNEKFVKDSLKVNNSICNSFDYGFEIISGFMFLKIDNDDIIYTIPDEFVNLIDDKINKNDNYVKYEKKYNEVAKYVSYYISSNGIIEDELLVKLLHDYHDIDVSISELDVLFNMGYFYKLRDKYYSSLGEFADDELNLLIKTKSELNSYQKITDDMIRYEDELLLKLRDMVGSMNIDNSVADDLFSTVIFALKYAVYEEDSLNNLFKYVTLDIKKSYINKISILVNTYKNDIPTWVYNGYSKNQYYMLFKSISRN